MDKRDNSAIVVHFGDTLTVHEIWAPTKTNLIIASKAQGSKNKKMVLE